MLVSCTVLRSAAATEGGVNELLEGAPTSLDIGELKRNLSRSIPEVRNVHHVHVWLVGEKPLMTLHVQVIPPHDHDALLERIRHFLEHHYEIAHSTIRWSTSLAAGQTATLTRRSPATHTHIIINGKARESHAHARC